MKAGDEEMESKQLHGSRTCPEQERFAIFLQQYDWEEPWRCEQRESGMNNTTRMIDAGDKRYVLRVYDNHNDTAKVQLEHDILMAVSGTYSLKVPVPVVNRNGSTVTVSPEGKLAALYEFIEGERPNPDRASHVAGLGRAVGLLSLAMMEIRTDSRPLYEPYHELADSYSDWTMDVLIHLAESRGLSNDVRSEVEYVSDQVERLKQQLSAIKRLPEHWIHGDVNFSNAVADGEHITGILDFEFVTRDTAVMEAAIPMLDFIGEKNSGDPLNKIKLFADGLGSARKYSESELLSIPDLMKLRMADVWLHFAVRLSNSLDQPAVWMEQTRKAAAVFHWVESHRKQLERLLEQRLR
ncbi:phosphotransferase [Paenibacillus tarimensis]|uniref:phosphotransferase n=1 Tax=Paenibacillus tarimensis TaxID=416012 RepID=UPI001F3FB0F9|nr:phosphotransferase [Paenibacillus tarimensis]MCF2942720.1 phosphotransferase [Paenibacillus tarimensis]